MFGAAQNKSEIMSLKLSSIDSFSKSDSLPELYEQMGVVVPVIYQSKPPEGYLNLFWDTYEKGDGQMNIDPLLETHNLINGITNSGKSAFAARFAEELLLKRVKLLVLDGPKGDYVSMKDKGKLPGTSVDVQRIEGDGAQMADRFHNGTHSFVFDRRGSEFKDFVKFFRVFFERYKVLVEQEKREVDEEKQLAERQHRSPSRFLMPVKIFIEEAQDYVPKEISTVAETDLRNEVKLFRKVVEEGVRQFRSYGKTFVFINQRPKDLPAGIRSQCEGKFMFRQSDDLNITECLKSVSHSGGADRQNNYNKIKNLKAGELYYNLHGVGRYVKARWRRTAHPSRAASYADIVKWSGGAGNG